MFVISILNQKGGAGKTTLATNFAKGLQLKGYKVLLIDSDPQGSARDWAAANESCSIPVVGIDRPTLERDIKSVSANYDYVIIDGAPQVHDLAVSAIKASDIILIPVQPSPYDIWATAELVDLVKQRISITDNKLKAYFVISRAIKGTKISKEIVDALHGYDLPVLEGRTTQRVIYPTTAVHGKSIFDDQTDIEAVREINSLIDEVFEKAKGGIYEHVESR